MVERAKEILMKRRNKSGEAAYRWLQKRSMDMRTSMRRVAEAILLSEEID
jgi:AmiR/NasT family two-component response regulator